MGKALLFAVVATIIGVGISLLSTQASTFRTQSELATYQQNVLAREVALTGLSIAVRRISENASYTGQMEGTYEGGTYRTAVTGATKDGAREIQVRITGAQGNQIHTIVADYESPQQAVSVPPFMQYAIMSNGNFRINGNIRVLDEDDKAVNANIHTNALLDVNGSNNLVTGFGTYADTFSSSPSNNISNVFKPNVNAASFPVHYRSGRVDVPVFMADAHMAMANRTTSGNLALTDQVLGTRDAPTIWYVNGDLSISGDVSLSGYGVFLVKGNITINGNVTNLSATSNESNLAFYSERDITIGSNVNLDGQLFANETVKVHGGGIVHGNIIGGNTVQPVTLQGSITVYYRKASPALTEPLWPTAGQLNLTSYREW